MKKLSGRDVQGQLMAVGGVKISTEERLQVNGSTLTITRVLPRDVGTYICSFQTMPLTTLNHTLEVQFAPKIKVTSDTNLVVTQGGQVQLSCSAEGNPVPRVRWTKQEGAMPDSVTSVEVSI